MPHQRGNQRDLDHRGTTKEQHAGYARDKHGVNDGVPVLERPGEQSGEECGHGNAQIWESRQAARNDVRQSAYDRKRVAKVTFPQSV